MITGHFPNKDSLKQVKHAYGPAGAELLAHCDRVRILSGKIARELKMTPEHVQIVEIAGRLHDIGKFKHPELFFHPGKFSEEEAERAKNHRYLGAKEILAGWYYYGLTQEQVIPVAVMIKGHHWPYNESGHLYQELILRPEFAENPSEFTLQGSRILKVVDCYVAAMEDRPHRDAPPKTSIEACNEIVAGLGTEFDPVSGQALGRIIQSV